MYENEDVNVYVNVYENVNVNGYDLKTMISEG